MTILTASPLRAIHFFQARPASCPVRRVTFHGVIIKIELRKKQDVKQTNKSGKRLNRSESPAKEYDSLFLRLSCMSEFAIFKDFNVQNF